jgi:hypothetical protein
VRVIVYGPAARMIGSAISSQSTGNSGFAAAFVLFCLPRSARTMRYPVVLVRTLLTLDLHGMAIMLVT